MTSTNTSAETSAPSAFTTGARESGTDQGSITILVVIVFLALLAAAGLVVDGGAKLRAARQASAVAEEAARAGAGQIDRDRALGHGGRFVIDRNRAVAAARAYLTSSGNTGTIAIAGDQQIRVTVTISKPTILLAAIGIGQVRVTKTATADLIQGVEAPSRGLTGSGDDPPAMGRGIWFGSPVPSSGVGWGRTSLASTPHASSSDQCVRAQAP